MHQRKKKNTTCSGSNKVRPTVKKSNELSHNSKILVTGGGKLPLWKRFIAAAMYTVILYYFIEGFWFCIKYPDFKLFLLVIIQDLYVVGAALPIALYFSVVITKYIDIQNHTLIKEYRIGIFTKTTQREIRNLEYVQVYHPDRKGIIEVRIWYQHRGYRMISLGLFDDKSEAMQLGKDVAQLLHLELAYTSRPGDTEWIDVEEEAIESSK